MLPATRKIALLFFLSALLSMTTSCEDSGHRGAPADQTATGSGSSADNPTVSTIYPVMQGFHAPMLECMERVWPSAVASYRQAQILMVEGEGEGRGAFLWRAQGNGFTIAPVDATLLDEAWFAPYNFGSFNGVRTLGVHFEKLREAFSPGSTTSSDIGSDGYQIAVETIFHESFHLFGQDAFGPPEGGRDQIYPIQWQPRYLRAQLQQALLNVLEFGGDLGAAAYWYNRYLTDHLDEALYLDYIDRTEGSAEYAAHVMSGLAKGGCDVPEAELLADLKADMVVPAYEMDASLESYHLGALAGLLLREREAPGWEKRVTEGATMLEVLLAGVESVPQEDNEGLEQVIADETDEMNHWIDAEFSDAFDALEDASNYRLVFDLAASLGSFSTTGTYRLVDHPEVNSFSRMISADIWHDALLSLRLTPVFKLHETPCEMAYISAHVTPVPESTLGISDGVYDAVVDASRFSGLSAEIVEHDGYRWLCPQQSATMGSVDAARQLHGLSGATRPGFTNIIYSHDP